MTVNLAQMATVVGMLAALAVVIPFILQLFVAPVVKRLLDDFGREVFRKLDHLDQRITSHVEGEGHHYEQRRRR